MTEHPFGTIHVFPMSVAPEYGIICIGRNGKHLGTVAEGMEPIEGTEIIVLHPEVLERLQKKRPED